PNMPSWRGMDLEEVLRRFEVKEGSLKSPDDVNHEEEEMVLDDFQVEKSAYVLICDEEICSFPLENKDPLDHLIEGKTKPVYNETSNIGKESSIQQILREVEETKDPELSLELLMQAMNLRDKREYDLKASINVNVGHVEVKQDEKYDVSPEIIVNGYNDEME
ncbi:hypothetical protein KI387_037373, partial [Taxus chinensis]